MCVVQDIEAKLDACVKVAFSSLEELGKRKSQILSIQNGSQSRRNPGKPAVLQEGSLRALWTEKAKKAEAAKKVMLNRA